MGRTTTGTKPRGWILLYGLKFIKQQRIKRIIHTRYKSLFDTYRNEKDAGEEFLEPFTIWCCWWQGEESMPEMVKLCYRSLLRNAGSHPVKLITRDNYHQYADIPAHIIEKLSPGPITITHFSDILRFALLKKHGGMWTDLTVLFTRPLPDEIPYPFFTPHYSRGGMPVTRYRWAGFLIYSRKNGLLPRLMCDFFSRYWMNEQRILNYLLIDYAIAVAYEQVQGVKELVDGVPPNSFDLDTLRHLMRENAPFDSTRFSELTAGTAFFKLNRKKEPAKHTPDGQLTYYGYICENY